MINCLESWTIFLVKESSLFVVITIYFSNSIFSLTRLQNLWTVLVFHHVLRWCKENIFQLCLGDSELNKTLCILKHHI